MNTIKKSIIKIFIVCICCFGIGVVCTRMPNALGAIYNSIFEAHDFFFSIFVAGCIGSEILLFWCIRKSSLFKAKKMSSLLAIIFAAMVSMILLATNGASLHEELQPNTDVTLIRSLSQGYEPDVPNPMVKAVVMEYFFGNKQVALIKEDNDSSDVKYIKELVVPEKYISYISKIEVEPEVIDFIMKNPYYQMEEYVLVADKYWKDTREIVLIFSEEKGYFISNELLKVIQNGHVAEISTKSDIYSRNMFQYLADEYEENGVGHIRQIVIILGLLFIGLVVTLAFWGEDYPALAFVMGLPVGATIWSVIGVVYTIANIPYNLFTMLGGIVGPGLIVLYSLRGNYRKINWKVITDMLMASIVIITVFTYSEITYLSYDSRVRALFGQRLAEWGSLRDIFEWVAPYGVFDPFILSMGYLFGIDILYAFYPLIALCGIAIMIVSMYYRHKDNGEELAVSMVVLLFGILLLLTNMDYLLGCFYIMAHGSTAVYTLIMIVFFMLKKDCNVKYAEYAILLSSSIIVMTRIEGAIYVLLFFAAMLGFEEEYPFVRKISIWGSGHIVLWNVFQLLRIGYSGSPVFWTPKRGVLLIVCSIVFIFVTWCMGREWKCSLWIRKHFYTLFILAIAGITVLGSVLMKTMAASNFPVFIAHFSNGLLEETNAAAVWCFILLLCPVLLLAEKRKDAEFAFVIIWGYVLFIYCICLFREGHPLKLKIGDSARRTLVQIMPVAIWLVAEFYQFCVGSTKKIHNGIMRPAKEERDNE